MVGTRKTHHDTPQSGTKKPMQLSVKVKTPSGRVSSELNRTKNTHRKPLVVKASQQKSTIATVRKSARLKDVKKSKAAFREVLQCQNSTDLLIPKKAVQRVVSESANNIKNRLRFKKVVIVDLQEMSEAHLTDRFNKKDLLVTHSRRMTIR